jgi:hypothetical protein
MRVFSTVIILLLVGSSFSRADSVPSYVIPGFHGSGLHMLPTGDLIVAINTNRDGRDETHFWNADKHQELPNIDSARIAHDRAAFDKVFSDYKLITLDLKTRGQISLKNGNTLSGEWLDAPGGCQWPYHSFLRLHTTDGVEKTFSFLVREPRHAQDLVYQCSGVKGASFLMMSLRDGFPLFYRRPGGGFYVTIVSLPYVIGFTDAGVTDFPWEKKPVAMFAEEQIESAYHAMAEGKMTPQDALDSLMGAEAR